MTRKQRRLVLIGSALAVLGIAAALVLNALRDSIVFFSTPSMVAEKNIQPGLDFFAEIAKQGRLSLSNPTIQTLEKGEVEVGVVWDFNGLSYRDQIDPKKFEVVIPSDGSVIAGYTTIINKWAKNPNAAKLAREYILSDAGQINLARGYARPIRSNVTLPDDVKAKLLPAEQYANAKPVSDHAAWEQSSKALPRQWQETVMINMQ